MVGSAASGSTDDRSTDHRVNAVAQHLNALTPEACGAALVQCCGAQRWVKRMIAERPYRDDRHLFAIARRVWTALTPVDWLEAFAAHPRIGERGTSTWSRHEQAGMDGAEATTRQALAESNREYERRFGHIFLICASGRTAQEMLAELQRRLTNDPDEELLVAAEEQAKITELRLRKLIE